jgi:hypothetical protein
VDTAASRPLPVRGSAGVTAAADAGLLPCVPGPAPAAVLPPSPAALAAPAQQSPAAQTAHEPAEQQHSRNTRSSFSDSSKHQSE